MRIATTLSFQTIIDWFSKNQSVWRRLLIGLIPIFIALLLGLFNTLSALRLPDRFWYDAVTLREPGSTPRVLIIRGGSSNYANLSLAALRQGVDRVVFPFDPGFVPSQYGISEKQIVIGTSAKRVPGYQYWTLDPQGPTRSALLWPAADYGLHRHLLPYLPGKKAPIAALEVAAANVRISNQKYLVRISKEQNLPRLDAAQLVSGDINPKALKGMIALVEPETGAWTRTVATARDTTGQPMTRIEYSAAAIQTLADGRATYELGWGQTLLLLLFGGLITSLAYLRYDPKQIILPHLFVSSAAIFGGSWLLLRFGTILLPVTSLTIGQLLGALLALYRLELDEAFRLRRFVDRVVQESAQRTLVKELAHIPRFAVKLGQILGVEKLLLIEQRSRGKFLVLEALGTTEDELAIGRKMRQTILKETIDTGKPIPANALVPSWQSEAYIAHLGTGTEQVFWIYAFPPDHKDQIAEDFAASLALAYRDMLDLRAELSPTARQSRRYRAVDDFAGSAVELVTQYGEMVMAGLDELETAVIAFHRIGFPMHANTRMKKLYDIAGLQLANTSIPDLLKELTDLDQTTVDRTLKDLLLNGGELRASCRDLDPHTRTLRVAVPQFRQDNKDDAIIVEVIDTTEFSRLSELRYAVVKFLDTQMRNDLEAIGLATKLVRDKRLTDAMREKILDQLETATQRAANRLNDVTLHVPDEQSLAMGKPFPVQPTEILRDAGETIAPLARDLGVHIDVNAPMLSGFVVAEPVGLMDMIDAILRIIIADTPQGETVTVTMVEDVERTNIIFTGGIGITLERLYEALDPVAGAAPEPFSTLTRGLRAALAWGAVISYSTDVGRGYRFHLNLRRVI